jgi:3-oxoacyl-[acyl-carrier-protein] synthase II
MDILGKGFAYEIPKMKNLRRADNFAKMAVAASIEACRDLELSDEVNNVSIILATQFGPHVTTFKFLDHLLDYSETGVSPTVFSHSVHNAAASYIASTLGIIGQTLTITSFMDPFKQALILGESWIKTKQASKIILCYVEEESDPFTNAHNHCSFPSYAKDGFRTGAAAILVNRGDTVKIPEKISNPFTYIEDI